MIADITILQLKLHLPHGRKEKYNSHSMKGQWIIHTYDCEELFVLQIIYYKCETLF